jgi:hypothetical protein
MTIDRDADEQMARLEQVARLEHLISVHQRILQISRECHFPDVEADTRAEIVKLEALLRLARSTRDGSC